MAIVTKTKFKKGDIVKYTSNFYGDSSYNPLWGGTQGKIKGTIDKMDKYFTNSEYGYTVHWGNGTSNHYKDSDLKLVSSKESKVIIKKIIYTEDF